MFSFLLFIAPIIYLVGTVIFTVASVAVSLENNRATPLVALLYILVWPILLFNQKLINGFTKLFEE